MGKKSKSGSGMNIPRIIFFESLETILWVKILKFFGADADPGIFLIPDLGSGINIPDPDLPRRPFFKLYLPTVIGMQ